MLALTRRESWGFTLVEMVIVAALVGILASIVLFSVSGARQSARVTKAETDLDEIKLAFQLYLEQTGSMPPGVGHCSHCAFRTPPSNSGEANAWETTIVPNVQSVVQIQIPARDPWGNHYLYDNNFIVSGAAYPSIICSRGPDGALNTWLDSSAYSQRVAQNDDICIFFKEVDDT